LLQRIEFPHKLGVCERLFGKRLARIGEAWVQTAAGVIWKLDLSNATHRWMVYGFYEGPAFYRWAANELPADPVVIDSGANIGQFAIYIASTCPKCRVYAFEPGAHASGWMDQCLRVSPLPIVVVPSGLSDFSGSAHLATGGPPMTHGARNYVARDGELVQLTTLDEFAVEHALSVIDLWKLDMEGHEIRAARGAAELLRRQAVRAIWCEVTDHNREIVNVFRAYGYACYTLTDSGIPLPAVALPSHGNCLFLPDSSALS